MLVGGAVDVLVGGAVVVPGGGAVVVPVGGAVVVPGGGAVPPGPAACWSAKYVPPPTGLGLLS